MLSRILTGIAVFLIIAGLVITVLPSTNEWVNAAENDPAKTSETTSDSCYAFGRKFGSGKRHVTRKAEALDADGYPDLPEGFVRPCDRDGDGVPDLPDGVAPRWKRARLNEFEDTAGRCGRGRQGAAVEEIP